MKKKYYISIVLVVLLIGIFTVIDFNIYDKNTLKEVVYNGDSLLISIDGKTSTDIPTSGIYYLTSYDCENSNTKITWNMEDYELVVSNGESGGVVSCNLEFKSKPKLSEMPVGSYVSYTGEGGTVGSTSVTCQTNGSASSSTDTAETEAPNSCLGQNAREDIDTNGNTYGYCYSKSYKYYTTGWRIAYIDSSNKPVIISAGSPECNTRASSTANKTYINLANTKAMKYCNSDYVDGDCSCLDSDSDGYCDCTDSDADGLCDEIENGIVDAWAVSDIDFYNMTKAISGVGKRLYSSSSSLGDSGGTLGSTLYCGDKYSYEECGYNNDLLDNGGYYWFSVRYSSSDARGVAWSPSNRYVYSGSYAYTYGLRPVISLQSTVYVTGGTGTMDDPYEIENFTKKEETDTLASNYIVNKYNDGSTITTANIGGDSSKPQVHLNATQGIMLDNNGDYRYYGANPNNYVSYNDELWRIISVGNVKSSATDTTGETRVKIVKADILTDDNGLKKYSWDSSASTVNSGWGVNDWSKSDLMTELNTLYFNSTSGTCYTGSNNATTACNFTNTGLSAEARNLTADALYYLGGNTTSNGVYPNDYYTFERGTNVYNCSTDDGACPRATTWIGRVGIIYPSDYAYATDLSVCTKDPYNYDTDNNCKNNDWLLDRSNYQWTISPRSSDALRAFIVYSAGYVADNYYLVRNARGVWPVQYLRSEVTIVEGEGTSTNPYKLGT